MISERNAASAGHSAPGDAFTTHFDHSLIAQMRPHQISAAKFLVKRLIGWDQNNSFEIGGEEITPHRDGELGQAPTTGAILADDMGTGKTFVALSVIWSLCRNGKGKGVIVCPSTLVGNWKKEILQWFPKTLGRTALFILGSSSNGSKGADAIVEEFITSHAAIHPVLVLSYDMFRIYADFLNTVASFSTIICDEGHRLKNAYGTKTTLALGNCGAMQRIVLTGTPIQNNLSELYAVVQFATPGYLGSLREFENEYSNAIIASRMKGATQEELRDGAEAVSKLRIKLSKILLRRNRDTILKSILPPRVVKAIFCIMSGSQNEIYAAECSSILNKSQDVEISADQLDITSEQVVVETSGSRDDGGADECLESSGKKRKSEMIADSRNFEKRVRRGKNDELEPIDGGSEHHGILSKLLFLRQICSCPIMSIPPMQFRATEAEKLEHINKILESSVKLRVLDCLLADTQKYYRGDKVVIVSNFISTLDAIHNLMRQRRYLTLRIDGDVAADIRQKTVDHFNNPKEPFFVMLLSARAGGVGLNLIGANHLVMMEPDWNPATDEQAMGRVWRDGQKKSVYIYRLIINRSIEETILDRQISKNELQNVLQETDIHGGVDAKLDDAIVSSRVSRDAVTIRDMILPPDNISSQSCMVGSNVNSSSCDRTGDINIRLKTASSGSFSLSCSSDLLFNQFKRKVGETVGMELDTFEIFTGFPPKSLRLSESESIYGKIFNNEVLRIDKRLNIAEKDTAIVNVALESRCRILIDLSTNLLISSVSKIISL